MGAAADEAQPLGREEDGSAAEAVELEEERAEKVRAERAMRARQVRRRIVAIFAQWFFIVNHIVSLVEWCVG
jgi:uncharacterized membrane protein